MGKLESFSQNRQLIMVAVILSSLLIVGVVAYKAGQKAGQTRVVNSGAQSMGNNVNNVVEAPEGITTPQTIFEDYKKQITENNFEGIDKTTLYINAAFAGAEVDAPEAADYAKEALNLLPEEMKQQSANQDLVAKLQKIAEGKYDEADPAV